MGIMPTLEESLPKSVAVLGRTVYVTVKKIEPDAEGETLGHTSLSLDQIVIDPNQSYESGIETFYHELAHVMLTLSGLDYVIPKHVELFAQSLGLAMRNTTFNGGLLK